MFPALLGDNFIFYPTFCSFNINPVWRQTWFVIYLLVKCWIPDMSETKAAAEVQNSSASVVFASKAPRVLCMLIDACACF